MGPWHRAVTDDDAQREETPSLLSTTSAAPFPTTADHIEAMGGLSKASETPRGSTTWHSEGGSSESQQGTTASSTSAPHSQDPDQDDTASTSTLWTRSMYPSQPKATTSSLRSRSIASRTEEEQEEENKYMPERTLRRMPRSIRIERVVSKAPSETTMARSPSTASIVSDDAFSPVQHPTNEHAQVPSHPSSATEHASQPTVNGSAPFPGSQYDEKTTDALAAGRTGSEKSTGSSSKTRKSYPMQQLLDGSSTLPDSPPQSETESEPGDIASVPQSEEMAVPKPKKKWQRRIYPLQSQISHADLQRAPTPPPSPPARVQDSGEKAFQDFTTESKHSGTKGKPLRRQVYPLQSPASVANLQTGTNQQPQQVLAADHTSKTPTDQSEFHQAVKRRAIRRQRYPLQAQASVANLQKAEVPEHQQPHNTASTIKSPVEDLPGDNQDVQPKTMMRRQRYPLQMQASVANLPKSAVQQAKADENKTQFLPPDDRQSDKHEASPQKSHSLRRQVYPLQPPASVAALRHSSAPEKAKEVEDHDTLSVRPTQDPTRLRVPTPVNVENAASTQNSSRESELATKVISQWRRQIYPVQSPNHNSYIHRAPSPQPPGQEAEEVRGPIHLPKNLRAVKDADSHDPKGRTIVVCLDGTGDKFDNDNSNIVHLVSALKKDDASQVSYYQAGIGTYGSTGGLSKGFSAAMDMAVGSGLGLHVRDAYHFLMHTYKEGDKICIFGFSRGAYTARCLAGMIHKVGLLPPRNVQQIPFAYEFYTNDTAEGWTQSEDFKRTFCIDVCVYFLGCFDSVASVGFIPRQLPLSSTPSSQVRYFRHAMALDERRAKFKICRHQTKTWDDIEKSSSPVETNIRSANSKEQDQPLKYSPSAKYGKDNHPNITDEEYESLTHQSDTFQTDVLEVWFAGAHADVGGGAVANDERHKLAQIPLRWMIRQAFECNTGIIFKTKSLAEFGLDVHTLWPKYKRLTAPSHGPPPSLLEKYKSDLPPRSIRRSKLVPIDKHEKGEDFYHLRGHADDDWTPEQVEDFYDAMSIMNDQLIQAPTWWILEFWPVQYKVPTVPGEVLVRTGPNLGRYRGVDDAEPKLHWTVLRRIEHMGYKIQARTAAHATWQTVV